MQMWDCNVRGLRRDVTVVILRFNVHPLSTGPRLTCVATAMLDGTTASDVGCVEGITLDGVARVLPAFLYHEFDDIHIDGSSEDGF